jgi:WD40 repeat protein
VESNQVFILSQSAAQAFEVLGFLEFDAKVCSASFVKNDGKLKVMAVLSNNLLGVANAPSKPCANRMVPMPQEEAEIAYRKIDKASALVIANEALEDNIYVTGDDKLLKKYEFPTDKISQIDTKRAPPAPIEEHESHSIGTTCWDTTPEFKSMVTGGKDGCLLLRGLRNIGGEAPRPIRAHALFSGGVTALCFSRTRSMLYTAGGDGSIMAWNHGAKPNAAPIHGNDMNAPVR